VAIHIFPKFMSAQIEHLRAWSHILFWCSVLLPTIGVGAGVARFYVDRKEKTLASAVAKAELDQSRKDFTDLKSQTAPRRLTQEQRAAITSILSQHPPGVVTFVSRLLDGEGSDFASDLGGVFTKCGWTVAYGRASLVEFQGVSFALVGISNAPPCVNIALQALSNAGVVVTVEKIDEGRVGGVPQNGLAIFIGRR
jgi:GH24 family phage-related lysozyme (muramidase)